MSNATSRKVADSISYKVTVLFNLPNPSSLTMALRSTPPVTEMSTKNHLGGGGGGKLGKAGNLTAIYELII
jgi:hypothetical protein